MLRGRCVGRGAAAPAGKGEGRRTAPAAAPCRGARLGQHPARAWRASVDTVCATFTSLPVYDHLTTRPDPLPIGRRCGRGVAPGGANVKPNRGAVLATTTYERRVMGDAVCRLRKRARRRAQVGARRPARSARIHTNWAVAYREARTKPFRGTPPATPVASRGVAGAARLAALRRAMAGPTARARANAICATMPSYA